MKKHKEYIVEPFAVKHIAKLLKKPTTQNQNLSMSLSALPLTIRKENYAQLPTQAYNQWLEM